MIYELVKKAEEEIKNKCEDYEIYSNETKTIELDSRKEELNFAKEEIETGIGIRVIKNNKIGFAFTSDMNKISETVNHAIENTKLTKADSNYEFSNVEKIKDVKKVYDKKFDTMNLDEYVEFLKNIINQSMDYNCEVTGSGFSATCEKSLILNSNGVSIENTETGFGVGLSVMIENGEETATAYNSGSSRFFDINSDELVTNTCNLAKSSLNTKSIETKEYDVVLDYYAATGLLQTFMSAFNGENVRRGRSILKDKIGKQITNHTLSIIDNPLLEKGMSTIKCDGEGSVSKPTELLKDGILNSFIYDIYTANKENTESTSNGYRGSYLTTPMISPSNLEFKFSENKDLSEIHDGIFITSVLGAHTANPISGDFSVEASNAFKIKNGDLTDPINKAMVSGNIFEIMKKIEGINSQIKQYGSFVIPNILAHDLRVVGQN